MTWSINCDMGEAYGLYTMGDDEAIMPFITVANVACGFHAADPMVMRRTVQLARRFGVKVGAHPSLPDREGFGRREMKMRPEEITNAVIYQVGALKGFLEAEGVPLNHIKPHGALYNMAARDAAAAGAIAEAAAVFGVPLYGPGGPPPEAAYPRGGTPLVGEFYADIHYAAAGFLVITREHAAVDPARQPGACCGPRGRQGEDLGGNRRRSAQSVCVHSGQARVRGGCPAVSRDPAIGPCRRLRPAIESQVSLVVSAIERSLAFPIGQVTRIGMPFAGLELGCRKPSVLFAEAPLRIEDCCSARRASRD